MSDWQILGMMKSPFYKETHHGKYKKGEAQIKPNFKITPTAYNDLMRYFKANGLNETDGFRQIVWDKLEKINTFQKRRVFNNIEFIMLLPKTDSTIELNEKARIIALYNTDCDFIEDYNYQKGFDKSFNYQYDLKPFGEGFFRESMGILNSTKVSKVKRVNKGDLIDWKSFLSRLEELNKEEQWDLNLRDCYFVRCPLNNYLDVNRGGQFQSSVYDGEHEGIYIFDDFKRRIFCILYWTYSMENKNIAFDITFVIMKEFMEILEKSDFKPLRESYSDLKNSDYDKNRMRKLIEYEEQYLNFLRHELEKM